MNNFAPVLICTLNRHVHFKRCVESLAACTNAEKTDLFIGFDYPLKEAHWEGYEIIKAYLPSIKGFKTVNIVSRTKNFGIAQNFSSMRNYVFERYSRLILSEDDNVFAASFLDFVNKGLSVYEDRKDIFSVAGYNSPYPIPDWYKYDAYLNMTYGAWGVGIWRDKWENVIWSLENYNTMLSKREIYNFIKRSTYFDTFLKVRDTGELLGDVFLTIYLLHNKMYSVFPVKSRVRNTGHDGSGAHGGYSSLYINQPIYEGIEEPSLPFDLQFDKRLYRYKSREHRATFLYKLKKLIPASIRISLKKYLMK